MHRREGFRDVYTAANAEEVDRFVRFMGPAQPVPSRAAAPPSGHQPISQRSPYPDQQQYNYKPSYHHQHSADCDDRGVPRQFPPHHQPGTQPGWDVRSMRQYGQPQSLHPEHISVINEFTQSHAQHQQYVGPPWRQQPQQQQVQHQHIHVKHQQQQWQPPFPAGQHAGYHSSGLLPLGAHVFHCYRCAA